MNTWWIGISSLATVAIAVLAFCNYHLASKIQKTEKDFRQQTSDLYQAIVISNMLSGPVLAHSEEMNSKIRRFKEIYKGKTPIQLAEAKKGGD